LSANRINSFAPQKYAMSFVSISLVAKGLYGIQSGRLPGGHITEKNTHGRGKGKGYGNYARVKDKGHRKG
jgi:hypothetical protein